MRRLVLPRSAKLTRAREFQRAFNHRRVLSDRYFRLFAAPAEHPRLGMVVSRRVSSSAVVRNRIRRLIRENFRRARPQLPALDVVVQARGLAAEASRHQLNRSLEQLWQKVSNATHAGAS